MTTKGTGGWAVVRVADGTATVEELSPGESGKLPRMTPKGLKWWKWTPIRAIADKLAKRHNERKVK